MCCVSAPAYRPALPPIVPHALAGVGISYLPEQEFAPHLDSGALVRLLEDWCPPFVGYDLHYPSGKQHASAFALVIEALRCNP